MLLRGRHTAASRAVRSYATSPGRPAPPRRDWSLPANGREQTVADPLRSARASSRARRTSPQPALPTRHRAHDPTERAPQSTRSTSSRSGRPGGRVSNAYDRDALLLATAVAAAGPKSARPPRATRSVFGRDGRRPRTAHRAPCSASASPKTTRRSLRPERINRHERARARRRVATSSGVCWLLARRARLPWCRWGAGELLAMIEVGRCGAGQPFRGDIARVEDVTEVPERVPAAGRMRGRARGDLRSRSPCPGFRAVELPREDDGVSATKAAKRAPIAAITKLTRGRAVRGFSCRPPLALVHGPGRHRSSWSYLAFKSKPRRRTTVHAESAGNQVLIEGVDAESIRVRNDTCEHFICACRKHCPDTRRARVEPGGAP
jgi:hypothetical protein